LVLAGVSAISFCLSSLLVRIHGALSSFPTRRSSDLRVTLAAQENRTFEIGSSRSQRSRNLARPTLRSPWSARGSVKEVTSSSARSEEHTSELQSRENLVCRLLLEKKKAKSIGKTVSL